MAMIYLTAADHINKHPYDVIVPAYYGPVSDAVLSGEVAPVFDPVDKHAPHKSRLPISHMISMLSTGVGFSLVDELDTSNILHYTDAYLDEVYESAKVSKEVRDYLTKVMPFRERMYICFLRMLNNRPQLKGMYTGEDRGVIKLLNQMLGVGAGPTDLLGNSATKMPPPTSQLTASVRPLDPNAPISTFYNA